jgi:O-acetyl-ADP-ribose deacetylase (regulator of RNase III)
MKTVEKTLQATLAQVRLLGASHIAIPLLGAGTGGLNREKVLALYEKMFKEIHDINIDVYIYTK